MPPRNDLVLRRTVSGNKGAMRAYLAFMGPRLAEMQHTQMTGSIYLHLTQLLHNPKVDGRDLGSRQSGEK